MILEIGALANNTKKYTLKTQEAVLAPEVEHMQHENKVCKRVVW